MTTLGWGCSAAVDSTGFTGFTPGATADATGAGSSGTSSGDPGTGGVGTSGPGDDDGDTSGDAGGSGSTGGGATGTGGTGGTGGTAGTGGTTGRLTTAGSTSSSTTDAGSTSTTTGAGSTSTTTSTTGGGSTSTTGGSTSTSTTTGGGSTGGGLATETVCKQLGGKQQLLDSAERWSDLAVNIPNDPIIVDVELSITAYHTDAGSLRFELRPPGGVDTEVVKYWACAEHGYDPAGPAGNPLVLDDDAPDAMTVGCTAPDFDPGTYQPNASPMATFHGQTTNGSWRLSSQASFWPGYKGEGSSLHDPEVIEWCLHFTF